MKFKKFLSGALLAPVALMPIAISAGCGGTKTTAVKGTMTLTEIKDSTKNGIISAKNGETQFSYADLGQDIDSATKSWTVTIPDPAKITKGELIPSRSGGKAQLFFSSFDDDNAFHGKFDNGQKPWDGPALIQIEGRSRNDLQFCNADSPVFVDANGREKSSGFINVESIEAKKITLAVRFMDFKGKKVSDKAYLLTITF
ncbi:variable surface lipoprotein [Mycoplasmopsis adleri]|uniref:variable surface lipoprotein n=1 Tax=Mycoplasmopsis adleri TaxID=51362 RepID=UPI003872FB1F